MQYDTLVAQIEQIAFENPYGFTIRIPTLEMVVTGIAVAHLETQHCYQRAGLYVAINHAIHNYGYLGGWKNEAGEMQYDSIRMFHSLPLAIKWGRKQKQRAVFDIDNGWEIIL